MDPWAALAQLPGVADSVATGRAAVDEVLWPRNLGSDGPALARVSRVRGAQANAALDGVDFPLAAWWSGEAWEDSAMGRTAAGVWRGYRELPQLVTTWTVAPLQALARLHALVAADLDEADNLGRPRHGPAEDPLRLGDAPPAANVSARLSLMARLAAEGTMAPAIVEAAVVHGEILALRPFRLGSGVIGRMSMRLVMAARGLDPDMLTIPEEGISQVGRPAYVEALRGYITGSEAGVASWIRFCGTAVAYGAAAADTALGELRTAGAELDEGVGKSSKEE